MESKNYGSLSANKFKKQDSHPDFKGNITINGDIKVNGSITATGDVIGGGISLVNHTHPDPQGGDTGKPG